MDKKVLILGSKGTLGRALVKEFFSNGYSVIAWDKDDLDLRADDMEKRIFDVRPDIIINSTGYNAVDKAETDSAEKDMAYKLNAEIPEKLANLAKKIESVFVNYSTDFVFDGNTAEAYAESDRPNPKSEYGKSKYLGEQKVAHAGGMYYIIRPSRIFGERDAAGLGKKSFVDVMKEKSDLPEVRIVADEIGSPTYAPDLAKFTRALIEDKAEYGIYHGTNSGACSWFDWAKEIFELLGKKPVMIAISAKEFNNPAQRPAYSPLLNTKRPPQRSWKEALQEFLK